MRSKCARAAGSSPTSGERVDGSGRSPCPCGSSTASTHGSPQLREGRWVLADLVGKGRRVRTVAVPLWVKQGINAWMAAAGIEEGRLLRSIGKGGKRIGNALSDWAVWDVVQRSAQEIGIERFGAHDLRRTCAKLCRKAGGDLEQIKFLLGHSSIQTTERYLGSEQEIAIAVNDNLGI